MNVSDFAAKGVAPNAVLVSLGLTRNLKKNDLEEIAKGLNAGAREYGAYIVGGDTGESCDIIIAIEVFGTSNKEGIMLRNGTREGDILAVTGLFGKTAAGLRSLQGKGSISAGSRVILENAVCMPIARLKEGLALRNSGAVTASIDSSDGLAWCLHELARQSGVGFVVTNLPIAGEAIEFAEANLLDATELTLYGGEEYELVVTINPKSWAQAESSVKAIGGTLIPIGKATSDKQIVLLANGKKWAIEPRGYEHFKNY
jgi:thiamine-monophosphate kinase